jgi:hypothetical protein
VKDATVQPDRPLFLTLSLADGWHPVVFDLVPAGPLRLTAQLAGTDVAGPLAGDVIRHRPDALEAVKKPPVATAVPGKGAAAQKPSPELTDGNRGGGAVTTREAGVDLVFPRVERGIAAVVLYAAPPKKDGAPWPAAWTVEVRTGSGRWREVKALETETLARVARPPGKHEVPQLVKLSFRPVSARAVRVRFVPAVPSETAVLTEIEVLRKR